MFFLFDGCGCWLIFVCFDCSVWVGLCVVVCLWFLVCCWLLWLVVVARSRCSSFVGVGFCMVLLFELFVVCCCLLVSVVVR